MVARVWAVIPTRDRPDELHDLLGDLAGQAKVVVVDTGHNPWLLGKVEAVVKVDRDPANISRWWNAGLAEVARQERGNYEVAILNDDLRIPDGTLTKLSNALRENKCAAAFPDSQGILAAGDVSVLTEAVPHNLHHRMTGYCFMLAGELKLRADESLAWWYGDDDLEWRAAQAGGVVRVGGLPISHLHPSESTNYDPELFAQAGRDRHTFVAKWGTPPW